MRKGWSLGWAMGFKILLCRKKKKKKKLLFEFCQFYISMFQFEKGMELGLGYGL